MGREFSQSFRYRAQPTVRAIVFDLYGTLIHEAPVEHCYPTLAATIGVSLAEYTAARQKTVDDAIAGRLSSAEARAAAILSELGRPDRDGLARKLAEIERSLRWPSVQSYPATLPTLRALRERGFRLGLVSDCTHLMGRPIPERLGLLPLLDAVALSCEVGHAKPSPVIYRTATEALGVLPEECLYVGDGGSDELNGARALGMTTARIDQEGCFARNGYPSSADYVIVGLHEVLALPPVDPASDGFPPLDLAWLRPDLAIGARVDPRNVPRLARLGIGAVVDLRAEASDDPELLAQHGLRFLHLPMPDERALTERQMREGSRWVAEQRASGRRVLIHCQHGVGRSVMLAAAVLLGEGVDLDAALTLIRSRRPRMALNGEQLAAVRSYAADVAL